MQNLLWTLIKGQGLLKNKTLMQTSFSFSRTTFTFVWFWLGWNPVAFIISNTSDRIVCSVTSSAQFAAVKTKETKC